MLLFKHTIIFIHIYTRSYQSMSNYLFTFNNLHVQLICVCVFICMNTFNGTDLPFSDEIIIPPLKPIYSISFIWKTVSRRKREQAIVRCAADYSLQLTAALSIAETGYQMTFILNVEKSNKKFNKDTHTNTYIYIYIYIVLHINDRACISKLG